MDVAGIGAQGIRAEQYNSMGQDEAVPVPDKLNKDIKPVNEIPVKKDEEQPLTEKEQQRRMERLQETLKNHNMEISYNEEVNRYAIKVLDADSKEVVKEIPSEKSLEMFARMLEIEGLLVDEKR